MRYLPHVEAAIARLGYIKPAYGGALAVLLEEHEGEHPTTIGRVFRQSGTQLPPATKKALGIRANAAMSSEAADALTQRGLSMPIHGIEVTLLDATFRYFRARSVQAGLQAGHDSFKIDGMFPKECRGCRRLNDVLATSVVLDRLPPDDCDREACALGMRLHIDFIGQLVEAEKARQPEQKPTLLQRIFGRRK